jgi:IgA Peptidase M64
MGTSDGKVLGTTNLSGNGFPAMNLVVMGDGYRANEMGKYHADVEKFITELFNTWPFVGMRRAIDIHRVDVTSTDSGPDDPNTGDCTGTGAVRHTYFDSTFCSDGIPRLLMGDSALAVATAK